MGIIDFHTHVFPERVADRAVEALRAAYGAAPDGPATIPGLIAAMDEAGVERAVICPVATRAEQVRSINRWVASLDRERIIPFGAMHPDFEPIADELAFLQEQGIRGLKLQPHFQGFALDDPATLRMFEHLGQMVVLTHGGQEIRPIDDVPTTPQRLCALHERFPQQRLVIAHLGSYRMWEQVAQCLLGKPVWFDLSFTFDRLEDDVIRAVIIRHGWKRVLFGSDYPWQRPAVALAGLRRLGLEPEVEDAILHDNSAALLGL